MRLPSTRSSAWSGSWPTNWPLTFGSMGSLRAQCSPTFGDHRRSGLTSRPCQRCQVLTSSRGRRCHCSSWLHRRTTPDITCSSRRGPMPGRLPGWSSVVTVASGCGGCSGRPVGSAGLDVMGWRLVPAEGQIDGLGRRQLLARGQLAFGEIVAQFVCDCRSYGTQFALLAW